LRNLRGRLVLILCVVLTVFNLGNMVVQQSYHGPAILDTTRTVIIPKGSTAGVADVLAADGVIKYRLVFRAAAWFTRHQGPIRAGEFLIPAHSSVSDILNILRHGQPVQHQVTIPEGLTSIQIAAILNHAAATTGSIPPPPDGSVLPQTYNYTLGTPRAAILARAAKAMDATLSHEWANRDPGLPLTTPQEALILASIVQQETPIPAELPEIAAVYENRLARGMKLQADPTVIYAASNGATSGGAPISRADLANPSPYNTYAHPGLPPGPIAAPGIPAIEAVLHPATTTALFFVATGTGGHVFADNFKQQLTNIAKYHANTRE
jgi:UPF0755 protein